MKSINEWENWRKSDDRPKNIPAHPARTYKNEWKSFPDFIGYEESLWSVRRVKELLKDWIESGMIYSDLSLLPQA